MDGKMANADPNLCLGVPSDVAADQSPEMRPHNEIFAVGKKRKSKREMERQRKRAKKRIRKIDCNIDATAAANSCCSLPHIRGSSTYLSAFIPATLKIAKMHFIKEAISPIICAKLALQLEEAASFWVDRKDSC